MSAFYDDHIKDNFTAVTGPLVTDDISQGYSVGSRWIDTVGGGSTICLDNTLGAAVWTASSSIVSTVDTDHFQVSGGELQPSDNLDKLLHAVSGIFIENSTETVTSDGATVTFNIEKTGTGDLTMHFDSQTPEFVTLDCTPIATIALTAGSDVAPQLNYVYVPVTTKVLTVSTSSYPNAEHIRVGTVLVQSAASVQTYGVYKFHKWADNPVDDVTSISHLQDINFWIRNQHATWLSGVAFTPTITTNGGALDNLDIANTAGSVLQLHDHTFPVIDTGAGDSVYVVNWSGTAYNRITDLNAIIADAAGTTLRSNNDRYNLVIWGSVSEDAGGSPDSKIFVNLPTGKYNADTAAINDDSKTADYNIPSAFKGTGFLIARLTVLYTTSASGTLSILQNESLLGQFPSAAAGGTASTPTEFATSTFRLQDTTDPTKEIAVDASAITTANTRTITMPDQAIDLTPNTGTFPSVVAPIFSGTVTSAGEVTVDDTTDSTSTTTGSIHTDGGAGIAKKLYMGDSIFMPSGKGIDFSDTADGSGTTDNELLDDYEEGSWTPTVDVSTIYAPNTVARYTKIGNIVTVCMYIQWTSGGAATAMTFSGLPFTSANIAGLSNAGTFQSNTINWATGTVANPLNDPNTATFKLFSYGDGISNVAILGDSVASGSAMYSTLIYRVD